MTFWIIATAATLAAGLWIARPFLKARTVEMNTADGTISIYRDQLDEVERDFKDGLIGAEECAAARAEIERRALKAARTLDQGFAVSHRTVVGSAAVATLVAAVSLGLYTWLGAPGAADRPLALRQEEQLNRLAQSGDPASRIQLLIKAVSENPDSFEDWWMLASSYSAIGDHASAADAYRNAAMLADGRPGVLSAYAESMTLANGNKVPNAALVIFDQLARETGDPRARYYLALAKAQDQDFEGAATAWAALARDSDPNAPWMPLVRRDIVNMARFLERDVTEFLPDATPEETLSVGGSLLPSQAAGDTAALEAAVDADPTDFRSWIALAERYAAAGETDRAAGAIASARQQFRGAPFVLQKIAEAEQRLGLDLIADGRRGPSQSDIAAAADMTSDERDDMIAGMVAGLAARLDEEPDDADGWMMLIRSYSTLGELEKAQQAIETARLHFADNRTVLTAITREFGELEATTRN